MEETVYCHHSTKDDAETHARFYRSEGFETKVEPDGERWLVTAYRDDKEDDAYTVSRLEAFRAD